MSGPWLTSRCARAGIAGAGRAGCGADHWGPAGCRCRRWMRHMMRATTEAGDGIKILGPFR